MRTCGFSLPFGLFVLGFGFLLLGLFLCVCSCGHIGYTRLNPFSYIETRSAPIVLQYIVILRLMNYYWMPFKSV